MKVYHKEFWAMHKAMKGWCDRQERDGWQSPEVKHWATFVLCSLWTLSHNKGNPLVLVEAMAQYMTNLEQAQSAHTLHVVNPLI